MFDHKIIFTGPVGAGKTTAITTYSDVEPILTEVRPSDFVASMKEQTTVAMDYGSITLDEETKVHLYGTPGQERFDFMWEILSKGSMGLVILINGAAENPVADLRFYLNAFKNQIDNGVNTVIGVNRVGKDTELNIADFEAVLAEVDCLAPVYFVDVRREPDVRKLVLSLLFSEQIAVV